VKYSKTSLLIKIFTNQCEILRNAGTVSAFSFPASTSFLHRRTFHRENANSDYDTRSYLWHHEVAGRE